MKYHLESTLPLRAFSPRSGRARGFAAGGMTLEGGGGGCNAWWCAYNGGTSYSDPAPAPAPVCAGAVVTQMYEQILGRAPDPGGYQAFVSAVNSGACVASLAQSMASSQEAQNNIASGQTSQAQVQQAAQNVSSPEAVAQISNQARDTGYVTTLYQTILGRAPDAAGLANNLAALSSGQISPEQLAATFANSQEAKNNVASGKVSQCTLNSIAGSVAGSYGQTGGKACTRSGDWSSVTPAQLAAAGITNQALLTAAANGTLNDNTFGSLGLDANIAANAVNSAGKVCQAFATAQSKASLKGGPCGVVVATSKDASGGTVYHFKNGSTELFNTAGVPVGVSLGVCAYRRAPCGAAVADNPQTTIYNGHVVSVSAPPLQWNPCSNQVQMLSNGIPMPHQSTGGGGCFFSQAGNGLANLCTTVNQIIPGGFTTIGMVAATALTGGLGSAGLAAELGGAVLGSASATGAATLGSAMLGSGMSALMAAATNGCVAKAALTGAVGGAIGANSACIANGLVGKDTVASIAAATGQTPLQVSNIISNSIATAVNGSITGKGCLATLIANNIASTSIGNYAGNVVGSLCTGNLTRVANAVGSVTKVATSAALNGKCINTAITNNIGSIIGNMAGQGIASSVKCITQSVKNAASASGAQKVSCCAPNDVGATGGGTYNLQTTNFLSDSPPEVNTVLDKYGMPTNDPSQAYYVVTGNNGQAVPISDFTDAVNSGLPITYNGMMPTTQATVTVETGQPNTKGQTAQTTDVPTAQELANDINNGSLPSAAEIEAQTNLSPEAKAAYLNAIANPNAILNEVKAATPSTTGPVPLSSLVNKVDKLVSAGIPASDAVQLIASQNNVASSDLLGAVNENLNAGKATTSGGTPGGVPGGVIGGVPSGTPCGVPGGIPGGVPCGVPGGIPGGVACGIPTGTPGGTTSGIPSGTPGGTTGGTPGGTPIPTGTPTGTKKTGTGTTTKTGGGGGSGGTTALNISPIAGSGKIVDLQPGLTCRSGFQFTNQPTFTSQVNQVSNPIPFNYTNEFFQAASGGSVCCASSCCAAVIGDLLPKFIKGSKFKEANIPSFTNQENVIPTQYPTDYTAGILAAATGGSIPGYAGGNQVESPEVPKLMEHLTGQTWRGHAFHPAGHFGGVNLPGYNPQSFAHADGGPIGHNPEFFSEGGLNTLKHTFVKGDGDGTSDSVPAMLANGEFVIPADVVSSLGNGSNDSGAKVLDKFLQVIRDHKHKADGKQLPPDSKGPLGYLLEAKRKVK